MLSIYVDIKRNIDVKIKRNALLIIKFGEQKIIRLY